VCESRNEFKDFQPVTMPFMIALLGSAKVMQAIAAGFQSLASPAFQLLPYVSCGIRKICSGRIFRKFAGIGFERI
jgi:hypothetical protein